MRRNFLRDLYRRRFLKPVLKRRLTGDVIARTCFWGLVWGLTPTVGLQALGVLGSWAIADKWLGYRFNVPIALVLTLVTNPFTIAPIYAFYFAVGCGMIDCTTSTGAMNQAIATLMDMDALGFIRDSFTALIGPYGIIWLGSLPFAIVGSIGGYYFGRYLGRKLDARRAKRAARRHGRARRSILPAAPVRVGGLERER